LKPKIAKEVKEEILNKVKSGEPAAQLAEKYGISPKTILGANLCTFNLFQGTEYMPSLNNSILFLEDDETSKSFDFDRNLQSLIHLRDFSGVRGIVIGRFQKESEITNGLLTRIIKTKRELNNIPVLANVDFGHTSPIISFPVGGTCKVEATKDLALKIFGSNLYLENKKVRGEAQNQWSALRADPTSRTMVHCICENSNVFSRKLVMCSLRLSLRPRLRKSWLEHRR